MTDGLFLRLLQDDPSLDAVGCVIFDELHERGLETDLSFALVREAQTALREDLRVVAMSATLDPGPVSARLGGAAVIESAGRMFPVDTRYLDREPAGRIEDDVAAAVRRALSEETGSALVFLPGVGEIRRVEERLQGVGANVDVAPLYGDLSPADQDRAIAPSPAGRRKVVLATSIAETSLTIEGVRIVIDSGQMRVPKFSPRSGMTRLETVRVSQASADQRRGRAGRLEPGICYRLWPEEAQRGLLPFTPPEILDADLAPLALELAAWGTSDAASLPWLTPPPAASLATARALLADLGAIDGNGAITPHGRAMARLGQHPRIAHLVLKGRELGQGKVAALLAAILGERDFLRLPPGQRDADLRHRVDIALSGRRDGTLRLIQESARRLMPRNAGEERPDIAMTGPLLALAYPDRIGRRRPGTAGRYLLSGGRGAALPEGDPMANEEFLVVADLDGSAQESRIFLAAPITAAEIEELYADRIVDEELVQWSARDGAVLARRRRRLGALLLEDKPLTRPDADRMQAAMLDGVRQLGLGALPWSDDLVRWRERIGFLRRHAGEDWPDLSDAALLASLAEWLGPYLDGVSRRDHLTRDRSRRSPEGAGAVGEAARGRAAGADACRGAERLAGGDRLCQPGRADAVRPPAGDVRPHRNAAHCRRQGAAHHPPALAGAAAGAGDARSRELLGQRLQSGEIGAEGPLSTPLLAGRSADRRTDGPGAAPPPLAAALTATWSRSGATAGAASSASGTA